MKEWITYKLKDICLKITDGSHFSPIAREDGYPMFSVKDMKEYGFNYDSCKRISIEDFNTLKANDCVPQKGDILVAKDGSFLKQIFVCAETREEAILSSIAIFRPNPEYVIPEFLCYILKSPKVYNYIAQNCVSGSALPRIVLKAFKEVEVSIPSIDVQKWIIGKLTPIDQKIQLNRQINDNLEQQAQTLYKSWFVDFEPFKDGAFKESEFGLIPEGWRVGLLSDLTEITMGQSPSGKSYNETGDGMLFYQGRAEFGDRYPSIRLYTTEPSRIAEQNSVLLSVRAPVGDTNIAYNKCCIGRGLASITAKHGFNSFIFYMIKSLKDQFDLYNGEGTVFGSINRDSLNSMKVIVPTNEVINDFEKIVAPLDFKYKSLFTENLLLTQQRDTLLPKLMSGELKINDLDC